MPEQSYCRKFLSLWLCTDQNVEFGLLLCSIAWKNFARFRNPTARHFRACSELPIVELQHPFIAMAVAFAFVFPAASSSFYTCHCSTFDLSACALDE